MNSGMRNLIPHAGMTEAAWQAYILAYARARDWMAYHTYDSRRSRPGFPDLVLSNKASGRMVAAELKTQRGRVSQAQLDWLTAFRRAGIYAEVWRPNDWREVKKVLNADNE